MIEVHRRSAYRLNFPGEAIVRRDDEMLTTGVFQSTISKSEAKKGVPGCQYRAWYMNLFLLLNVFGKGPSEKSLVIFRSLPEKVADFGQDLRRCQKIALKLHQDLMEHFNVLIDKHLYAFIASKDCSVSLSYKEEKNKIGIKNSGLLALHIRPFEETPFRAPKNFPLAAETLTVL